MKLFVRKFFLPPGKSKKKSESDVDVVIRWNFPSSNISLPACFFRLKEKFLTFQTFSFFNDFQSWNQVRVGKEQTSDGDIIKKKKIPR